MDGSLAGTGGTAALDPARLVFSAADLGIGGYELQERLYREAGISLEMADHENVIAVVTWANTWREMERLAEAARRISEEGRSGRRLPPRKNFRPAALPRMALTPREAYFRNKRTVAWSQAAGQTAGEAAAPYPPGIPLVCPGEVLEREIWEELERCRREGISLHGPASPGLETFQII